MDGWMIWPAGGVDFDTFAREFFLNRGLPSSRMQNASYWHHLVRRVFMHAQVAHL